MSDKIGAEQMNIKRDTRRTHLVRVTRRSFLGGVASTAGALALPTAASSAIPPSVRFSGSPGLWPSKCSCPIEYIRKTIPEVSLFPYQGTSYDEPIPDTLDLAERASFGINALTRIPDSEADYEVGFTLQINRRPVVMSHEWSDYVGAQPKFMEALTELRMVIGNTSGMDAELGMMITAAHMLGRDGLYYQPIRNRHWALRNSVNYALLTIEGKRADQDAKVIRAGQFSDAYSCGRLLLAMTLWWERDKNAFWRSMAERMIKRFHELAVDKGDYAYFPWPFIGSGGFLTPGEKPNPNASDKSNPYTHNGIIHALSRYFRVTGYEPALRLASKLSHYMKDHSGLYDAEGRAPNQQFHGSSYTLLAMLEYATLARDQSVLEFVRKSYEWHRSVGSPLVGFFPEVLRHDFPTTESCCIADMLDLAVRMSQLGVGDYWDDADRYVRNQFAENQLTNNGQWMQQIADQWPQMWVAPYEIAEDAIARNIGAFAGWARPNDFIRGAVATDMHTGFVFMHCCTGNSNRAIYYAWQGLLDLTGDRLRVNLLLNRASPWADVYSFLPYEGRVNMVLKRRCRVSIRIPDWVERRRVVVRVGEENRSVRWEGRYLNVGECVPQDKVSITFPIMERIVQEVIGGTPYTLTLKGNDVVLIDPPGRYCPLYQRAKYRKGQVLWKTSRRFLSEETLTI